MKSADNSFDKHRQQRLDMPPNPRHKLLTIALKRLIQNIMHFKLVKLMSRLKKL